MNALMMYDSTFGNTDEKIPLSIPHAYCDGFVIGKFPFVTAIRATPPRYRPAIEVQPFHRYRLPCVLSYQQSRAEFKVLFSQLSDLLLQPLASYFS